MSSQPPHTPTNSPASRIPRRTLSQRFISRIPRRKIPPSISQDSVNFNNDLVAISSPYQARPWWLPTAQPNAGPVPEGLTRLEWDLVQLSRSGSLPIVKPEPEILPALVHYTAPRNARISALLKTLPGIETQRVVEPNVDAPRPASDCSGSSVSGDCPKRPRMRKELKRFLAQLGRNMKKMGMR